MKVLQLASSQFGGTGIAATRLHNALLECGTDSTLITRDNKYKNLFSKVDTLASSSLTFAQRVLVQKSSGLVTPLSMNFGERLTDFLGKADVIHLHSNYNLISIETLVEMESQGKLIVFTLHDERRLYGGCHYAEGCNQFQHGCAKCPQATWIGKSIISTTQSKSIKEYSRFRNLKIICPSDWMKSQLKRIPELNEFNSYLVPNPIPRKSVISSESKSSTSRHEGKISLTFISADLNNPIKNFRLIQDSLHLMEGHELERYRLNLVGQGNVGNLPTRLEVTKHGALTESAVSKILSETDALIVPSLIDNSPNVVSEGLMAGCIVIGSSSGGISERLREFGMPTVNPRDPEGLLAAIRDVVQSPKNEGVSEMAERLFGFEKVGQQVLEIYRS